MELGGHFEYEELCQASQIYMASGKPPEGRESGGSRHINSYIRCGDMQAGNPARELAHPPPHLL
jgi:hypothetical protein